MKKINVSGPIVDNNLQRIYDWIGFEATSPSKVISSLPQDNSEIEVLINSVGGDVFAASEIFTALKGYNGNVTVKIIGLAASAASVIAMAGDKVLISPTAQMMIHNVSTGVSGDYRTFEHTAEVLKSANQSIINAYKTKTSKSDEELQSLMDIESWFNAQTAVEHGFADEIMFNEKIAGGTLINSFGTELLNDDLIAKITEMMDKQNSTSAIVEDNQKATMQAKLNLLKLGGKVHEY